MNRRDLAVTNANRFVDHLYDGCQAVGGAGGCGHDPVLCGVVQVIVDAHHDVQNVANLDGGRHDDTPGASIQMPLDGFRGQEFARALEYEFDAKIAPGNFCGRRMRRKAQATVADANR